MTIIRVYPVLPSIWNSYCMDGLTSRWSTWPKNIFIFVQNQKVTQMPNLAMMKIRRKTKTWKKMARKMNSTMKKEKKK